MTRLIHVTTTDMSLAWLLRPQLEAFREAGYEVVTMSAPGRHVAELEAAGFEHVAIESFTRSMAPHRDLLALHELWRAFRRLQPAIVHTHNPKPGVLGRVAARAARVPAVVNTVHGLYAQPTDRWRRRAAVYTAERIACAFSHVELLQNEEDLDVLRRLRVPARRLRVLGNGVDLGRFHPAVASPVRRAQLTAGDDNIVVCGLVGRLVAEKGYREVFEAARILRERAPNVRFAIIGPDETSKGDAIAPHEKSAARDAGVFFLGQQTDVEAWYPAFDIYVLASYREGFPRSAMEAAAMGLPIIATDIRGCRQVVEHEVTGLLVPPKDAAALASAVGALAADAGRRSAMGAAAAAKALRDFDHRRVIDITLDTYRELLARRSS